MAADGGQGQPNDTPGSVGQQALAPDQQIPTPLGRVRLDSGCAAGQLSWVQLDREGPGNAAPGSGNERGTGDIPAAAQGTSDDLRHALQLHPPVDRDSCFRVHDRLDSPVYRHRRRRDNLNYGQNGLRAGLALESSGSTRAASGTPRRFRSRRYRGCRRVATPRPFRLRPLPAGTVPGHRVPRSSMSSSSPRRSGGRAAPSATAPPPCEQGDRVEFFTPGPRPGIRSERPFLTNQPPILSQDRRAATVPCRSRQALGFTLAAPER